MKERFHLCSSGFWHGSVENSFGLSATGTTKVSVWLVVCTTSMFDICDDKIPLLMLVDSRFPFEDFVLWLIRLVLFSKLLISLLTLIFEEDIVGESNFMMFVEVSNSTEK